MYQIWIGRDIVYNTNSYSQWIEMIDTIKESSWKENLYIHQLRSA